MTSPIPTDVMFVSLAHLDAAGIAKVNEIRELNDQAQVLDDAGDTEGLAANRAASTAGLTWLHETYPTGALSSIEDWGVRILCGAIDLIPASAPTAADIRAADSAAEKAGLALKALDTEGRAKVFELCDLQLRHFGISPIDQDARQANDDAFAAGINWLVATYPNLGLTHEDWLVLIACGIIGPRDDSTEAPASASH